MDRRKLLLVLTCVAIAGFAVVIIRRKFEAGGASRDPAAGSVGSLLEGIHFEPEKEMAINERQRVSVRVSNEWALERSLQERLKALDEVTAEPLQTVQLQISAHLTGDGFAISPPAPVSQVVGKLSESEWTWEIIPKSTGMRQLSIAIVLSRLDRARKPMAHINVDRAIVVR